MDLREIAAVTQHTNVNATATRSDIARLCDEATEFDFDGVMVQPCWIGFCRERLPGRTKVCSALAFPMGGALTRSKVAEMQHIVSEGADEIDFLPNLGFLLLSGDAAAFEDEIAAVVEAAAGRPVKAMLELEALTPDERRKAVLAAEAAGCAYVKNSSGWGVGGKATPELIGFMRSLVSRAKVKASGGIRTREQAEAILSAGAALIGTSAGPLMMRGVSGDAVAAY
jgi:deoxyribose-phosphate aldolase